MLTDAERFEYWEVWESSLGAGVADGGLAALHRDLEYALRPEAPAAEPTAAGAGTSAAGAQVGTGIAARVDVGLARTYRGDLAGATVLLAEAAASARRHGRAWDEGYAAFAQGTLAAHRGDRAGAADRFRDAGRAFGQGGDLRAHGYALVRLGRLAATAGDAAAALAHRLSALELFRRVGDRFGQLTALHAPALSAPAAAGGPGGPALDVLTRREREVAELVGTGLTNRQIGDRIAIAERTVDTHVQRILAKLHCASRVQVAVLVVSGG